MFLILELGSATFNRIAAPGLPASAHRPMPAGGSYGAAHAAREWLRSAAGASGAGGRCRGPSTDGRACGSGDPAGHAGSGHACDSGHAGRHG